MDKHRRKTLIGISTALAVVIIGIVYLSLTTDPNSVIPVNDGYDLYRVSLHNAKDAFDDNEVLFVDVRSEEEFIDSHIPGAVVIPLNEITGNEPAVDKGALIYTYCT